MLKMLDLETIQEHNDDPLDFNADIYVYKKGHDNKKRDCEGQFNTKRKKFEGIVRSVSADGNLTYEGQYLDGVIHGFGKMHYRDMKKDHIGFWRKGLKHGVGREVKEDGTVIEGFWDNGEYVK